jgi:hypothetical protein
VPGHRRPFVLNVRKRGDQRALDAVDRQGGDSIERLLFGDLVADLLGCLIDRFRLAPEPQIVGHDAVSWVGSREPVSSIILATHQAPNSISVRSLAQERTVPDVDDFSRKNRDEPPPLVRETTAFATIS